MKLWHGSPTPGIVTLKPHAAEHGEAVFLTDIETLAALYAHPNHVWYTYCFTKDRRLVYDEVFPDQFRRLYQGKTGYIYTVETDARRHERMPWVYMSGPANVTACTEIPDLYGHLLAEIEEGRLILRRHADMPEKVIASYRQMTVDALIRNGDVSDPVCEYAQFVQTYLPECWEEALRKTTDL